MPMEISNHGINFLQMRNYARRFSASARGYTQDAAKTATAVSRDTFRERTGHRPFAPPRSGRPTTGGNFTSEIQWEPGINNIELDFTRLPEYALIQEIGTGQSATILNPAGSVVVRSQVGRHISQSLFFAPGVGEQATRGNSGRDEQLFYASDVNTKGVRRSRRTIQREIIGKHYIQAGGRAGFLELSTRLTDEAKRMFS